MNIEIVGPPSRLLTETCDARARAGHGWAEGAPVDATIELASAVYDGKHLPATLGWGDGLTPSGPPLVLPTTPGTFRVSPNVTHVALPELLGPGQPPPGSVQSALMWAYHNDSPMRWTGDRPFLDIRDAADALVAAAALATATPGLFHTLLPARGHNAGSVTETLNGVNNTHVPSSCTPRTVEIPRPQYQPARDLLGWQPQWRLTETLRQVFEQDRYNSHHYSDTP